MLTYIINVPFGQLSVVNPAGNTSVWKEGLCPV